MSLTSASDSIRDDTTDKEQDRGHEILASFQERELGVIDVHLLTRKSKMVSLRRLKGLR